MFILKIDNFYHIIRIPVPEEEVNKTNSGKPSSTIDHLKHHIKGLKASSNNLDYDLSPHDIQQYAGISLLFVACYSWDELSCGKSSNVLDEEAESSPRTSSCNLRE
ncbi:unnamed protein product [Arctia plantaginis]|uniref:Uncharacterized protein n=1 Tax=Arctia plantaginis TaxID=874455 RepID=A0A8S1APE8_ARCPL|nr:unnamed protein product [Arctia plantaginis]